jgi:hypothetical protein
MVSTRMDVKGCFQLYNGNSLQAKNNRMGWLGAGRLGKVD